MNCLHCQQPIKTGRVDRRFCNDACKTDYHNAEKIREHHLTREIILRLKHNRRILEGLLGEQKEVFMFRDVMLRYGFDFNYHTHRHVSGQGNTFLLCFDFGYRMMDDQRLKIVRWNG